ncbi:TonB-dependent receptor domain-containing protein [Stutzerimonas urumqiensis]|uniref:TonB-dependent receptor domain-containing protein n=1 Tax=Stutzerimonas urumqiensis TaxID=638269 RepID=UPI000EACCEE7|nr:TonB-dependent receptor [Stutzerimonas urumqiensis]
MKLSRLALAVALASPVSMQAFADDAQVDLPALVVTSGRVGEARSDATAATTVFTRADIERLRPRSVGELLERVPGATVVRNGGAGNVTGLFIRGMSSAQTLVLVDGQRIAAASNGAASLEFLDPSQIERIEVVRGTRSALYGSDAIGGVVQIFTRRADRAGAHPYLRLAAGSDGTFERSLGVSGGTEQTRVHLGASLSESEGFDITQSELGESGDDDALRKRSLSLNVTHRFSERAEAGLSLLDQRGQVEFDDIYAGTAPYDDYQLSAASAFFSAQLLDRWHSRLEIGHSEDKRDTGNDASFAAASDFYTYNTYRDSASWVNTLQLAPAHQLLLGADWYEDRLHATTTFVEESRWNQAAFIQHRYQGEAFATELGLRHDDNEQFGSVNTWSGALTLPLGDADQLILSYSEGFRAPTFNDLYYPDYCYPGFGCFASANPDLQPETSRSYEAQWRHAFSETGSLEASLYRIDLEDAIVFTDIPRNVQTARVNGFEATYQETLLGWQTRLAVGILDPRDRDSGHVLPRRAKRTASLDLDRRFGAFGVGGTWRLVSSRYDDAANDVRIGGYGVVDVRGSWNATPTLEFDIKIANLLGNDYVETTYRGFGAREVYETAGTTALLGMTWTPTF